MRTPSSPVLRTRPCPTFGRPVRLGFPHRLRPGTSPHALRIPPHGGHPALRSTASSGSRSALAVSNFRLRARLDVSIPSAFFGQRGITPAFGYGAPHSSARGTLTLLNNALLSAHFRIADDTPGTRTNGSSVSASHNHILFSSARFGYKDEAPLYDDVPQPYAELFLMNADGSNQGPLTDNQGED